MAVGDLDIRLAAGARTILDRELSPTERAAFLTYMDLLLAWQRVYRLVGSSDRRWVIDELILDSLLFVRFLPAHARSVLDLGSGAGIPGIPLRIVRPMVRFTLLEARRRRSGPAPGVQSAAGHASPHVSTRTGCGVFRGRN